MKLNMQTTPKQRKRKKDKKKIEWNMTNFILFPLKILMHGVISIFRAIEHILLVKLISVSICMHLTFFSLNPIVPYVHKINSTLFFFLLALLTFWKKILIYINSFRKKYRFININYLLLHYEGEQINGKMVSVCVYS